MPNTIAAKLFTCREITSWLKMWNQFISDTQERPSPGLQHVPKPRFFFFGETQNSHANNIYNFFIFWSYKSEQAVQFSIYTTCLS